jgi:transposase
MQRAFQGVYLGARQKSPRHWPPWVRLAAPVTRFRLAADNYAAHKHPKVRQWLDRHPRFTFHFTPTSCSWLNAVEGFFAKLANRRLTRGVFRCVVDLQAAINRFVAETNHDPKPFTWTADPDKIIACETREPNVRFDPLARPMLQLRRWLDLLRSRGLDGGVAGGEPVGAGRI